MSEQTNERVLTMSELGWHAQVVRSEQPDIRMFHIDAACRLKLRSLLHTAYPMVFDTMRQSFDASALVAQGIWPYSLYIEVEASAVPLAAGRPGQYACRLQCGQIAADRRGAGTILMATQVTLKAQASSGQGLDFTAIAEGEQAGAGRLMIIGTLLRLKAPAEQRTVTELPKEMAALSVLSCEAPPATVDPGPPSAEQRAFESAQPAQRVLWGLQHTDANLNVMSGEYLTHAEDYALVLAREAGLPIAKLRFGRARLLMKRGFVAAQEAVLRGRLTLGAAPNQCCAFITFHALDAQGQVDPRPAIEIRLDTDH
jgi:hypothetical protein